MDILCITIVYEADADDSLQRFRSSCGNLEGIESGPGLTLHTDVSVAPWLCSNPVDGIDGIILFLLQILIVEAVVGFAGTAHVHADNVVSHSCEVSVHRFVSASHTVSLTIWLGFEDGWQRFVGLWFPHTCRTSASVGHRYPDIFNDFPLIRELFPGHYSFLFKFLFSHSYVPPMNNLFLDCLKNNKIFSEVQMCPHPMDSKFAGIFFHSVKKILSCGIIFQKVF